VFVGTAIPSFSWKLKGNPNNSTDGCDDAEIDSDVAPHVELRQTAYKIIAIATPGDEVSECVCVCERVSE